MELTIQRETLLKPLQMASGIVEKKQTMPILSHILFDVSTEGLLSLTATDSEIEFIARLPLTASFVPGKITVPGRKLMDICRTLPENAEIMLYLEDNQRVVLRSGRSRFILTTQAAKNFPAIEEMQNKIQFLTAQKTLYQLFSNVYFSMAQQDVRYYLNGTLFDIDKGTITCVATDGHRLAYSKINEPRTEAIQTKVIIPRKTVLELLRVLSDNDTEIEVSISDSHFRVASAELTLTSKLLDAQYPDYKRLIPKEIKHTAMIERSLFKQALMRTAILSNETYRGVRLSFNKNLLQMTANNPESEEAKEEMNLGYDGDAIEIGFNVNYLMDIVSAIPTENVICSFNNPNSSMLIEPVDSSQALYVVMPMHL